MKKVLLLIGLVMLLLQYDIDAVNKTVLPGSSNSLVTLNIPSPGTPDSITVVPGSDQRGQFEFCEPPSIANNPTGLWYDNGNNTFAIAFIAGGATSADVLIIGKLKLKPVGGGGAAGGPPPCFDFSLPGLAVLAGSVGAVFLTPTEIWVEEGEFIPCIVKFSSGSGSVTSVGQKTFSWQGQNLGNISAGVYFSFFQTLLFSYTVANNAANKQGSIKGVFANIQVNNAGNFTATATSVIQKAFKATFQKFRIDIEHPVIAGVNPPPDKMKAAAHYQALIKFHPKPEINVSGRISQYITSNVLVTYPPPAHNRTWSKDGGVKTWDGKQGMLQAPMFVDPNTFRVRADDYPGIRPELNNFLVSYRQDFFDSYVQLKIGSRPWRTFGYNFWGWTGSYPNGTPVGSVVGAAYPGSNNGQGSSLSLPDQESSDFNEPSGYWIDVP